MNEIKKPKKPLIFYYTLVLVIISLVIPKVHDSVARAAVAGALLTSVLCTLESHGVAISFIKRLPLYDLGLSWVIPAAVFGLAAAALSGLALHRSVRCPTEEH